MASKVKKIVILDAHHDSYCETRLSHYSFAYHIKNISDVEILYVGVRYDLDECEGINNIPAEEVLCDVSSAKNKIDKFIGKDKFYFSVDLDVIDPNEFKSVAFPVNNGLSADSFFSICQHIIGKLPKQMDVVEFNPRFGESKENVYREISMVYKLYLMFVHKVQ